MKPDLSPASRCSVPPRVKSQLVGDETVILDLESGMYFGLDGVGKLIWESIKSGHSLSETAASIVSEYDVDEPTAQADVIAFAADLMDRGLLEIK
jgi:hypothetical protein